MEFESSSRGSGNDKQEKNSPPAMMGTTEKKPSRIETENYLQIL